MLDCTYRGEISIGTPGEHPQAIEERLISTDASTFISWPPGDQSRRPWQITEHARSRARDRGCALAWLLHAVTRPLHAERDIDGSVRYGIDPLAVIAQPSSRRIVTVLLCRHVWPQGRWTDKDAQRILSALPFPDVPGPF